MSNEKFDQWCIVELFGHQRIAGRVTEQTIGGSNFVRVDVPPVEGKAAGFTRLFGQGAIYGINPVTEEIARMAAANIRAEPIGVYDLPSFATEAIRKAKENRLSAPALGDDEATIGEGDDAR